MRWRLESLDVVAAVVISAAIVGGGLFFLTVQGTTDFTQFESHADKLPSTAMAQLNGVTDEHLRWQNSPFGYLDSIKLSAAWTEADLDKISRVDGPAIVNNPAQSPSVVWASFLLMSLAAGLLVCPASPASRVLAMVKLRPTASSAGCHARCEARGVTW